MPESETPHTTEQPSSQTTSARRWTHLGRRLAFSLGTTLLFFVVLELLLAACGVQPITAIEDPYVGFASYLPLFVEETVDGREYLTTAPNKLSMFNRQRFPRRKAEGSYRIFCLGGSTTYGRPYDDATSFAGWLREFLKEADRSRQWEVINAGGISYASYRVAKLMEELQEYEPDLFIIYSGHNEFLERRTYGSLLSTPESVRGLSALLSRTRTFALIQRILPERSHPAQKRSAQPAGAESQDRFQLPSEVETILDSSVGPEAYTRDDLLQQQVLQHYEFNMRRMIDLARQAGAAVVLVTPASNLRDCSPFKSEHQAGLGPRQNRQFAALDQAARDAWSRQDAVRALELLNDARRIDRRYADLHYLRGKVLDQLDRYDESKTAYVTARDEDVCPLRALSPVRDIVQRIAAEEEVACVDFVQIVADHSAQGIPGRDWFMDHVHPTVDGNRLLASSLLEALQSAGIVTYESTWNDAQMERIAQSVVESIDPQRHGVALRNLSKVLGWAGKREEAARLAQQAVELAPNDPETQWQAGIVAEEANDLPLAEEHYREALRLDASFVSVYVNLGVVLAQQERLEEADRVFAQGLKQQPDHPLLLANRARVAALQEDFARAVEFQQQAVRAAPESRRPQLQDTLRHYQSQLTR